MSTRDQSPDPASNPSLKTNGRHVVTLGSAAFGWLSKLSDPPLIWGPLGSSAVSAKSYDEQEEWTSILVVNVFTYTCIMWYVYFVQLSDHLPSIEKPSYIFIQPQGQTRRSSGAKCDVYSTPNGGFSEYLAACGLSLIIPTGLTAPRP